jgi:hypothetical protein
MTLTISGCRSLVLAAFLLIPLLAYPQVTLTGAIQFSANSSGAFSGNQSWNTLGGDACWDLWLAQNPDASHRSMGLPMSRPASTYRCRRAIAISSTCSAHLTSASA